MKLGDFVASIIPVKGLKEGYKALKGLVSTIDEKRKEQDALHVVDDYLNGFMGSRVVSANVMLLLILSRSLWSR